MSNQGTCHLFLMVEQHTCFSSSAAPVHVRSGCGFPRCGLQINRARHRHVRDKQSDCRNSKTICTSRQSYAHNNVHIFSTGLYSVFNIAYPSNKMEENVSWDILETFFDQTIEPITCLMRQLHLAGFTTLDLAFSAQIC